MDGQQKPTQNDQGPVPSAAHASAKPVGPQPSEPTAPKELEAAEEQMTSFEKATLRWAKAAVIMAFLAAVFVCLQWIEMKSGSKDTHDLAVAAGNQANWTKNLAGDMKTQADRTKDLADRMKDQADRTKTIADQAIIQANANKKLAQNAVDSLSNTKQSFRDEQRAWIGVQGTVDSKGFTQTEPWQVTVVFFNSGRTPARNVQTSSMYITSRTPLSGPSEDQIKRLTFRAAQSFAPQGYYRAAIGSDFAGETNTPVEFANEQVLITQHSLIEKKQLFLYYFGVLKYNDIFGKPHETQYCILLANPDTKEAGMCDAFNDLD